MLVIGNEVNYKQKIIDDKLAAYQKNLLISKTCA